MDTRETNTGTEREELFESLFRHADSRPRPPQATEQEVRSAVEHEWRAMTGRRRRRRRLAAWGLAASGLLAAVLLLQRQSPPAIDPGLGLANIEQSTGQVFIRHVDEAEQSARRLSGTQVTAGMVIRTGSDSRIGLTWSGGESVRLDENSELTVVSTERMSLARGRIYVDSGDSGGNHSSFAVRTPAGDVRHLGTQYLASVEGTAVAVSVREGKVLVGSETADRGQRLSIGRNGQASIAQVETYGEAWEWTEALTPTVSLDGLSAHSFIQWAARQSGRQVSYDHDGTEALARRSMLSGGEIQAPPDRALELILQTSDLEHEIVGGEIRIRERT